VTVWLDAAQFEPGDVPSAFKAAVSDAWVEPRFDSPLGPE